MSLLASLARVVVETIARVLPPPRVIFDRLGNQPYLSRWYLLGAPTHPDGGQAWTATGAPREGLEWRDGWALYLHQFHTGDDDPQLHNHPWSWAVSLILAGGYTEERREPGYVVSRDEFHPGSINWIEDQTFHRVELLEHDSWSLFLAGPKVSGWGFWDRKTGIFTPWREHIAEIRSREAHS